jgi:chromosome segregation ATPase
MSTSGSTKKSGKAKKTSDPSETSKLLAAKISQLESDRAGEKDQEAEIEREVKKANRDLSNLLSNIESPLFRLNEVQRRYTELLADMRRLDRDHAKNKKRADQLQKEKDQGRTELNKAVSMKEKLEKLCRELQRENKKMKVRSAAGSPWRLCSPMLILVLVNRRRIRSSKRTRSESARNSMRISRMPCGRSRRSSRRRRIQVLRS